MKQQHSALPLLPSKLCRLLFFAFCIKLSVLGTMIFEPNLFGLFTNEATSQGQFAGKNTAHAATTDGAGAPPSISNIVPDVGMNPPAPQRPNTNPAGGMANPYGTPAPQTTTDQQGNWTLPQVPDRPKVVAGQNATQAGAGGPLVREALVRKQEELARKEQELRALDTELSDKLEKMQLLENRLTIMMKDAEDTKDAKFRHLVDVLSNMKAKSAAQVLETLDRKIAVRVLAGMRGRQAGEILTFVKPEIAASLTEALTRMQLPLE